jgi:ribosomal-protein-alanine N-acetyltransferase
MVLSRIEGKRICLRRIRKADAHDIYRLARNREITRFTFIPRPYTLDNAEQFIKLTHKGWRTRRAYRFGIEDRETRRIIGIVGLEAINYRHKNVEIGYWLGRPYWGKGLMTEAICLALRVPFKELRMKRVFACVFPDNTSSIRLLERIGFTFEGRLRNLMLQRNRWQDAFVYSMLNEEYRNVGRPPGNVHVRRTE